MKVKDAGETPVRIMAVLGIEYVDPNTPPLGFWERYIWRKNRGEN
jgi:hypothetical protein